MREASVKQAERTRTYTDILQGRSQNLSLVDLARAGDHFFSDLSILPAGNHARGSLQGGR